MFVKIIPECKICNFHDVVLLSALQLCTGPRVDIYLYMYIYIFLDELIPRFMLLCSNGLQINVHTIHQTRFNSTFDIHVHMYKVQSLKVLKIIYNISIYSKQISVHKLSTS